MKILLFSILISLFNLPLFSQTPVPLISRESKAFNDFVMNPENIPVIKGKFVNYSSGSLKNLNIGYEYIYPYQCATEFHRLSIAEDGSFQMTLPHALPYQQIFFFVTNYCFCQLFVTDSVYLEIDMSQLEGNISHFKGQGISFGGTDGELCNFMHQYFWFNREQENLSEDKAHKQGNNSDLSPKDPITKCIQSYNIQQRIDSLFLLNHPSPYETLLRNRHQGEYLAKRMESFFADSHYDPQDIQKALEDYSAYEGYLVCHECNNYYSTLALVVTICTKINYLAEFCQELLKSPNLPVSQEKLLRQVIETRQKNKDSLNLTGQLELIRKIEEIRDYEFNLLATRKCIRVLDSIFPTSKADQLKLNMLSGDTQLRKNITELLLKNIQTPWCLKLLNEKYQQILTETQKEEKALNSIQPFAKVLGPCDAIGKTPAGALLYKTKATEAKKFLAQLKAEFPGKTLILELWATWCGWCPTHLRICNSHAQQLKEYPVDFVYLCSSSHTTEEKWKILVAKLGISGIHIFVDNDLNQQLFQVFSLPQAVPQVVYINSEGKYLPDAIPNHFMPDNVNDLKKLLEQNK